MLLNCFWINSLSGVNGRWSTKKLGKIWESRWSGCNELRNSLAFLDCWKRKFSLGLGIICVGFYGRFTNSCRDVVVQKYSLHWRSSKYIAYLARIVITICANHLLIFYFSGPTFNDWALLFILLSHSDNVNKKDNYGSWCLLRVFKKI